VSERSKKKLKKGDRVAWNSSQGIVDGVVVKTLKATTKIKGHTVNASPEHPEVLVESEKTGARAAHEPSALKKR
jgi:hypothetical protein